MKSLKKLSIALAPAVALFLAVASVQAIPTWAENYGVGSYNIDGTASSDPFYGSGVDIPRGIAPMPDGGFVVAGQIAFPFLTIHSSYGGKSDACLVRFAADGTILWQNELRQLGNDSANNTSYSPAASYIARIRTDAQGNIFIAGGKGNSFNGGQVPFVAKFSPAGQLIWQNGIPEAGGTVPGAPPQSYKTGVSGGNIEMTLTFDGGVVITGEQGRPTDHSIPIIAKFDANGAVSFYRAYESPDQGGYAYPVAQSADGSKYVTIQNHLFPSQQAYGLYVFTFDASSGNVLTQQAFQSPDGGREYPTALIRTSDGGFASLSVKDDFAGIIFRKFNGDASAVTVERLLKPATGQQVFYVGSLSQPADTGSFAETADGGFLIGGHTRAPFSSSGEDAALMKLKADGTVEFVSLIGGAREEGNFNGGSSGSVATPLTDGGYGIAIISATYTTQPAGEDFRQKPDWWVVKADSKRKVRNFTANMVDLAAGSFSAAGSPHAPIAISYLTTPTYTASPLPSTDPAFTLIDLGTRTGIDQPSLVIQASSPRIVSSHSAEAVVGQHFSYHTVTAFFPDFTKVTFSATNLPQGFVIDTKTGVISGVAPAGSETVETNLPPIPIVIHATDGTDATDATVNLAISDGVPRFTVNDNDQPTPNVADTVLTFVARQPGKQAARVMNVQATTTPATRRKLAGPAHADGWLHGL
ncbi:MAG: putative Ig domain-containing protein [Verrucomicrobiota bacterium]|nr:putative Ig domain-containing protein [Verrucomicrobiota bacterium]